MKLKKAFFLVTALVFLVSFTKAVSDIEVGAQVAQVNSSTSSQEVSGFTLINPTTGVEIGPLTEGYNIDLASLGLSQIDIRANTTPATVGSVRFYLDSGSPRTRNARPYLYGPTSLGAGAHSIVATPYTLPRGRGIEGIPKTVNFTVSSGGGHSSAGSDSTQQTQANPTNTGQNTVNTTSQTNTNTSQSTTNSNQSGLSIASFTLINADTDQDIRTLQNGETIDISQTPNIAIRANTNPSTVGSVRFWVNQEIERTENVLPYALAADGNNGQDYYAWDYPMGQVTITAIPSELPRFRGAQGTPLSIIVNIADGGGEEGGQTTFNRDADVPENIIGNGVQAIAPDPSASYIPGQQGVPFTCDIGTDPGFHVWKLVFSSYQVIGGQSEVYPPFAVHEGVQYTTGQYTETITIPDEAQPGAYTFHCVAYFYDSSTDTYSPPGLGPAEDGLEVQIGTHQEPTGETSTLSISAPATNSNVVVGQPFTFSVQGSPTNDEIQSVDFYLHPGFGGLTADPVLLGSDSTTPFSLQATVSERYYRCPQIYAVANLSDGTQIKTNASGFHPVTITDSPTSNPWQCTPQSIGGNSYDFSITSPQWASTSDPGYDAGVPFTISAQNNLSGVAMDYVKFYTADTFDGLTGWDFTLVSTDTAAPYTTQAIISTPADYGHPYFTNHVRAIAYYSNGQVEPRVVPIKINPAANLPQMASIQLVNTQGAVLDTLTSGDTINIGTQGGGYGTGIALKANPDTGMPAPASVKFRIESTGTPYESVENNPPYSSHGDSNGTYNPWAGIVPGAYTLKVTPYTGVNATGSAGPTLTIPVVVVNNDDTTPPPVPTNVAINFRSANEVRLSWNASADAVSYKVYRNPGGVATLGNVTSFIDSSASGSSSYNYQVTALDAAGNESSLSSVTSSPALSTQFTNGQNVQTQVSATVYNQLPNPGSTPTQSAGAQGVIQGTSVYWNGQPYWFVNFNTGADGWVLQSLLTTTTTPPPPTPVGSYTCPTNTLTSTYSINSSMQLCASVSTSPASITINWAPVSGRTLSGVTIYRKSGYNSTSWGGSIATLSGSSTSWTDTSITPGSYYEYKVVGNVSSSPYGGNITATGYISTGTGVTLEEFKGKIILVVDNTYQTSLAQEIQDLQDELLADKWIVSAVHYVNRTDTPSSVKSLIQGTYNQDPTNTKAVYLIGRVPVAYAGNSDPDGHADRGMAADTFYGDMTSTWNSVANGCSPFSWNPQAISGTFNEPPSTSKFCHSNIPSSLELQVGRVDMYQLPSSLGSETTMFTRYFDKVTDYKKNLNPAQERVLIRDFFSGNGWTVGAAAHGSLSSVVDYSNVTTNNSWGVLASLLNNQSYMFVYANYYGVGQTGSDQGVAGSNSTVLGTNWGGVFNQSYGSYYGEWSASNAFLRAIIADNNDALTMMYGGNRQYYLHHMGMGQNIGFSVLKSINNTSSIYSPHVYNGIITSATGNTYMALMGDPTIRPDYVSMPSNLTIGLSGGTANISWTSSPESGVIGYHVYKINQNNIVRLTNTPVAGNTYSVNASSGDKFMVTAVKPKVNASGNYLNESLGLIGVVGTQQSSGSSNTFSPGDSVIVTDGTN